MNIIMTTKNLFLSGIILGTFLAFFASLKLRNHPVLKNTKKRKKHYHVRV